MKPVQWGILSTARIGVQQVIPAMQGTELCAVAAIASRDAEKARKAAEVLGIPRTYGSYRELVDDPDVEAIYNPLPNHLHVPWSIAAAEAGKHVLCEKPLALNASQVESLIEARDRAGVLIQEAIMVRYHPQWLRARELVRSGQVGQLRAIQGLFSFYTTDPNEICNRAEIGGGAIYDIGCYPITAGRFFFEDEPTRVLSLIERDPAMQIDRLTSAILEFPQGHASFTCATQLVHSQILQILGTTGRIEMEIPYNPPPDRPSRIFLDDGRGPGTSGVVVEEFPLADQYGVQAEVVSRAIRTGEPLEFPLENSVQGMRIVDALFRSGRSGNWEVP